MEFDPIAAADAARTEIALRKSRHFKKRRSKLEPFRHEIVQMYQSGASLNVIATHLSITHKKTTARSTILRYLNSIGAIKNG